jgi:hypothetical protein
MFLGSLQLFNAPIIFSSFEWYSLTSFDAFPFVLASE